MIRPQFLSWFIAFDEVDELVAEVDDVLPGEGDCVALVVDAVFAAVDAGYFQTGGHDGFSVWDV